MNFIDDLKLSLPAGLDFEELFPLVSPDLWERDARRAALLALAASRKFDANDYLARYPDVAREQMDPIMHFVWYGLAEKREFQLTGSYAEPVPPNPETEISADKQLAGTYSIIVTLWKRKAYLEEQYLAFKRQSIKPSEIIYIINENHISPDLVRYLTSDDVCIIQSDLNSLYTRFAMTYNAAGDYVAIVDDDIIPGEYWFANAMRCSAAYNAYVVGNGRIYCERGIKNFFRMVGPHFDGKSQNHISCSRADIFCDWGCNSYFIKRAWAGHLLSQMRYSDAMKTFDDIQSAFALNMSGNIPCVCPMQPREDSRYHASLNEEYGNDSHAVWLTGNSHFPEREKFVIESIKDGYNPVYQRDNLLCFHVIFYCNQSSNLICALNSLSGQIYANFSCTVCCVCGENNSLEQEFNEISQAFPQFRFIHLSENVSPDQALTTALATKLPQLADCIIFIDGDSFFAHPHVLRQLNQVLRVSYRIPQCGVIGVSLGAADSWANYTAANHSVIAASFSECLARRFALGMAAYNTDDNDCFVNVPDISFVASQQARIKAGCNLDGREFLDNMLQCKQNMNLPICDGKIDFQEKKSLFEARQQAPTEQPYQLKTKNRCAIISIADSRNPVSALLALMSYKRNLQAECELFIYFESTENNYAYGRLFAQAGITPLFATSSVKLTNGIANIQKKFSSNPEICLLLTIGILFDELLEKGFDAVVCQVQNAYIVADITDLHLQILSHSFSVVANKPISGPLFHDGITMIAVATSGQSLLTNWLKQSLAPDEPENRLELPDLLQNLLFQAENPLLIIGGGASQPTPLNKNLILAYLAPGQRGFLLDSGDFVRIWRIMPEPGADLQKDSLSGLTIVAIHAMSELLITVLLAICARLYSLDISLSSLTALYERKEEAVNRISRHINIHGARHIFEKNLTLSEKDQPVLLWEWADLCLNSICFDNLEIFAQLLIALAGKRREGLGAAYKLRRNDPRYLTENVLADPNLEQKSIADKGINNKTTNLAGKYLEILKAARLPQK